MLRQDGNGSLLTVGEAATYLNVGRSTVYRWIDLGGLPVRRVGPAGRIRIEPAELDAWLGRESSRDRSRVLSRSERIRLLAESDGDRRDVEVSPGTWVRAARPLTAQERAAYLSATSDEIDDARVLLDAAAELLLARLVSVADRFEELVTQAKPKMESR